MKASSVRHPGEIDQLDGLLGDPRVRQPKSGKRPVVKKCIIAAVPAAPALAQRARRASNNSRESGRFRRGRRDKAAPSPPFAKTQQRLTQMFPQTLNTFRCQGDEAFITPRHHHRQAVIITIRKFARHGGSLPPGFAHEKLRLTSVARGTFDEPVKRTIGTEHRRPTRTAPASFRSGHRRQRGPSWWLPDGLKSDHGFVERAHLLRRRSRGI